MITSGTVAVSRTGGGRRARGFTLVELMVVISIIALLVAMLIPYFGNVFAIARKLRCQNNLEKIAQAMHTRPDVAATSDAAFVLPSPAGWIEPVIGRASKDILYCDEDHEESNQPASPSTLENVYILQIDGGGPKCSFITDILAGKPVPDNQILLNPARTPHQGDHDFCDNWYPHRKDNQQIITIDDDGACMITYGVDIKIESLDPEGDTHCGSKHWVMRGKGNPYTEDDEILHLTGNDYQNTIDPRSPAVVATGLSSPVSYGMNAEVSGRRFTPGQFMIMDAHKVTLYILEEGDYGVLDEIDEVVAPRHLGKANVVTVGGTVTSLTLDELIEEKNRTDRGRWNSARPTDPRP